MIFILRRGKLIQRPWFSANPDGCGQRAAAGPRAPGLRRPMAFRAFLFGACSRGLGLARRAPRRPVGTCGVVGWQFSRLVLVCRQSKWPCCLLLLFGRRVRLLISFQCSLPDPTACLLPCREAVCSGVQGLLRRFRRAGFLTSVGVFVGRVVARVTLRFEVQNPAWGACLFL